MAVYCKCKSKQLWYKNLKHLYNQVERNEDASALLDLLDYYAYSTVNRTIIAGKKVYKVQLMIKRPRIMTNACHTLLRIAILNATRLVLNEYA